MNSRNEPDPPAAAVTSQPPASRDGASAASSVSKEKEKEHVPLWLRRVSLVVFVLCCLEIGLLLVVLPWTTIWTENSLLVGNPRLQTFVRQNFVRGLVSGLGLLDIWLGVWEALHYRERRKTS
ncbi:MAG: hypothetical protein ACRD2Q_00960 [Terriglobales bacterium]